MGHTTPEQKKARLEKLKQKRIFLRKMLDENERRLKEMELPKVILSLDDFRVVLGEEDLIVEKTICNSFGEKVHTMKSSFQIANIDRSFFTPHGTDLLINLLIYFIKKEDQSSNKIDDDSAIIERANIDAIGGTQMPGEAPKPSAKIANPAQQKVTIPGDFGDEYPDTEAH